jgi:hypothetical protein
MGVAPSTLLFKNVLAGSSSQKAIQVFGFAGVAQSVIMKKTGDVAAWLKLSPEGPISVPPGGVANATLVVTPPLNTPTGLYRGEIILMMEATGGSITGGAGAQLTPGAVLPVEIEVTASEAKALVFVSTSVHDVVTGSPVAVQLVLDNPGNVPVKPEVEVQIVEIERDIVEVVYKETLGAVQPGSRTPYMVIVPSSSTHSDKSHIARVSVFLEGVLVGEISQQFGLLEPVANVTYVGSLLAIEVPPFTPAGKPMEITADAQNTGTGPIIAAFRGYVEQNGRQISVVSTESKTIPSGEGARLTTQFIPPAVGEYRVVGHLYYGATGPAQPSAIEYSIFEVFSENGKGGVSTSTILLIGGTAAAAVLVLVLLSATIAFKLMKGRRQAR